MNENQKHSQSLQRILSITEEIIMERGCSNTTLQEIINRSGLSKGAIYHYVNSKDELFGLILQARMEEINSRFGEAVAAAGNGELQGPLRAIQEGFNQYLSDSPLVTNQILIYLLSQKDNPRIQSVLHQFHEYSLQTAAKWIQIGQQRGAIPETIDARKVASIFQVFSYGLRVQHQISPESVSFDTTDIFKLLFHTLRHQE